MESMNKKAVWAWCWYDWANGPFSAIVITFVFAPYFSEKIAVSPVAGAIQWGYAMAVASLMIALTAPLLGAIADYEGRCKPWLAGFSLLAILSAAALWFAYPGVESTYWVLFWVVMGTVGLELGIVFFNALLRNVAPISHIGRVSGWAWGMSYFSNLTCLCVALFGFVQGGFGFLNLDQASYEQVRICGPLVSVWFFVFALPLFKFVPDRPRKGVTILVALRQGFVALIKSLRFLSSHKDILRFLVARMLYTDGLNTIFALGGIYAAGTFGMTVPEVLAFGLTLNLAAGLGAISFARMDDTVGPKKTILVALLGMMLSGVCVVWVEDKQWFWGLALILSLFMGPVQAASRSLMARLAPTAVRSELFGLYALSGKATAFLGPWLFAIMTGLFSSQRVGIASTLIFIVVGAVLLLGLSSKPAVAP